MNKDFSVYKSKIYSNEKRYNFVLNPFEDEAFTECPKCNKRTEIQKYCLILHIEPHFMFSINQLCRYCSDCDLLIVDSARLEKNIATLCKAQSLDESIITNDYFVFGTLDKKIWEKGFTEKIHPLNAIDNTNPFKHYLDIKKMK